VPGGRVKDEHKTLNGERHHRVNSVQADVTHERIVRNAIETAEATELERARSTRALPRLPRIWSCVLVAGIPVEELIV
jgi:hypothetical protein